MAAEPLNEEKVRAESLELYAAYCEFKNDAVRSILRDEDNSERRSTITQLGHAMSQAEFTRKLLRLAKNAAQYQEFRELILAGWHSEDACRRI